MTQQVPLLNHAFRLGDAVPTWTWVFPGDGGDAPSAGQQRADTCYRLEAKYSGMDEPTIWS